MSIQFRYGFLEMPKQRPTSIERQASQQKRSKETHVRRAPLGQVGSGKVLQPAVHTADKLTRHYTHTHPFNGPLPGTTRVSRYQKGKPIWILLKQETVSGSGICWAIYKAASRCRQITMPAPHHSVFYRPDALAATQPTASKHWRQICCLYSLSYLYL